MLHDPASISGQLQSEIQDARSQVYRKADSHEVYALASRVDRLEHTVQDLRTTIDGLQTELQAIRESIAQREEAGS